MFFVSCSKNSDEVIVQPTPPTSDFIRAVDVSFIPLIESEGTIYKSNNVAQDPLVTLKNAGCNTLRIRLWKDPIVNQSTLAEVKTLSLRAKQAGFKVWLCVHYSDIWADPGNQETPAVWQNLNFNDLKVAAVAYTSMVLNEIKPDIIQIGNEINSGFMWPQGNLINNQAQSLALIGAISDKIRMQSPNTKIMLHYAGIGADASWFFNKMTGINYDYIGLSYYPIWHGKSLVDVNNTITTLGQTHNKKVIIAETSYPFTLGYNDFTNNVLGLNNQILTDYPATIDDQKNYLLAIKNLVKQNQYGLGFCYWGGEWVAFRGTTSTNGSSWENQALWDFNLNALPAMSAFSEN